MYAGLYDHCVQKWKKDPQAATQAASGKPILTRLAETVLYVFGANGGGDTKEFKRGRAAASAPASVGGFPVKREWVWIKRKGFLYKFAKPVSLKRHAFAVLSNVYVQACAHAI